MKRFLLIGYNFSPELTGIGKYSGEMVQWLAEQGYDCTVITAYPYYPHWKVQPPYGKTRFWYSTEKQAFASGGHITTHRCPMYVPARPSGLKRMLLDGTFLVSACFRLLGLLAGPKFDTVFVVAPSFQFGLLGVLYKKVRQGKFVYHIQDLQIEAARDLRLITSAPVIRTLFTLEKYLFTQADTVSSISAGMMHRIRQKAHKPVLFFPNWTDTALFYPITDKAALKQEFGLEPTNKIVLYSGAIGEKQGLEAILQAAHTHRAQQQWTFVICGSGPYRATLQALAERLALANVVFLPLQPTSTFNRFLNMADLHLVIQKATASDLVMPSKLATILAVGGLALITARQDSDLGSLVETHGIGRLVAAENQLALNDGIHQALTTDSQAITARARQYAEQYLSLEGIMRDFVAAVA